MAQQLQPHCDTGIRYNGAHYNAQRPVWHCLSELAGRVSMAKLLPPQCRSKQQTIDACRIVPSSAVNLA